MQVDGCLFFPFSITSNAPKETLNFVHSPLPNLNKYLFPCNTCYFLLYIIVATPNKLPFNLPNLNKYRLTYNTCYFLLYTTIEKPTLYKCSVFKLLLANFSILVCFTCVKPTSYNCFFSSYYFKLYFLIFQSLCILYM